jgi:hypothetical protein
MLGRRGGRKRAEARLVPEIEKREKEIDSLKDKLEESEVAVRVGAAKSASESKVADKIIERTAEPVVIEKIVEKISSIPSETIAEERKVVEKQQKAFEQVLDAEPQKAVETEMVVMPAEQERPEEIEKQKATIEREQARQELAELQSKFEKPDTPARVEQQIKPDSKTPVQEKIEAKRDPRSMSMPELLAVAENIGYEKSSLRQLYERNRIDAVNLRRVVIEYFNGGTGYERLLHQSLQAVEMQRELRGEIKDESGFNSGGGSGSSDDGQAVATPASSSNESALVNPQQNAPAQTVPSKTNQPPSASQPNTNMSTAIVIGVVLGLITVILLFAL